MTAHDSPQPTKGGRVGIALYRVIVTLIAEGETKAREFLPY
jgi:hypothetical protein